MKNLFIGQEFSIKGMKYIISHFTKNEVVYHFKRGGPAQVISHLRFEKMLDEQIISLKHEENTEQLTKPLAIYFSDLPEQQQSEAIARKQFIDALNSGNDSGRTGDA